jgi:hypothetical protein
MGTFGIHATSAGAGQVMSFLMEYPEAKAVTVV